MILDLLTPESHENAYIWAAVMLAHAAIGAAMWAVMLRIDRRPGIAAFLAMILYGMFEAFQAMVSGVFLFWDSLLDWCAVGLGATLAAALWGPSIAAMRAAVLAAGIIVLVGAWVRL